jgi:hypothetical protein
MGSSITFFFLVLVRIGFLNRGWIYLLSILISNKDKRLKRIVRMRTFFRLAFTELGDKDG